MKTKRTASAIIKNKVHIELKESEQLFRATFEQSAVGFKHTTLDGRFIRANKKFYEITGYNPEDLEKTSPEHITYPGDLEVEKKHRLLLLTGEADEVTYDKRYVRKDGSVIWCNLTCSIIELENSEKLVISAVKDITEEKKSREREIAYRIRNYTLLEISRRILDHIQNYESLLNYVTEKTSNVLGDCCVLTIFQDGYAKPVAFYHPDKELTDALAKTFEITEYKVGDGLVTSKIIKGEPVFIPRFGKEEIKRVSREEHKEFFSKYKLSSLIAVPLRAGGNTLGHISLSRYYNNDKPYSPDDLLFLQKIADRVSFAIVISRLYNEKIRELEERRQAEKNLEQFAYIASHDLQEPLRMVSNFVQLLEKRMRGKINGEEEQFMQFITQGAKLMQTLISDLLRFSRLASRDKSFEETDMNEILKSTLQNLSIAIAERNAGITNDPLPVVRADKTQMIQLLQNLIGNALKFTSDKTPRIHIGCTLEDNYWKFSISDNGIGINPEHFERIFLIFNRLHTREEYTGTGIGLAMCKKIVDHHEGKIWVESEEGKGSVFYFTIPGNNIEEKK